MEVSDKRILNYRFGLKAEFLARSYLRLKFYNIIYSRYRNYAGEIDIIASRGNIIVFVEVKARKNSHMELFTYNQQDRIKRSALLFLSQNNKYNNFNVRFDLIIVKPYKLPIHIINAW